MAAFSHCCFLRLSHAFGKQTKKKPNNSIKYTRIPHGVYEKVILKIGCWCKIVFRFLYTFFIISIFP